MDADSSQPRSGAKAGIGVGPGVGGTPNRRYLLLAYRTRSIRQPPRYGKWPNRPEMPEHRQHERGLPALARVKAGDDYALQYA
ncbi:hypothetical protein DL769_005951 [Monosporascus sp. CRB-8-3]|nr:hypothetical protein DL769_005951 [Monosporascus sp. CRB-8-3]